MVATPGRLNDLLQCRAVKLNAVAVVVLDEAVRAQRAGPRDRAGWSVLRPAAGTGPVASLRPVAPPRDSRADSDETRRAARGDRGLTAATRLAADPGYGRRETGDRRPETGDGRRGWPLSKRRLYIFTRVLYFHKRLTRLPRRPDTRRVLDLMGGVRLQTRRKTGPRVWAWRAASGLEARLRRLVASRLEAASGVEAGGAGPGEQPAARLRRRGYGVMKELSFRYSIGLESNPPLAPSLLAGTRAWASESAAALRAARCRERACAPPAARAAASYDGERGASRRQTACRLAARACR